MTFLVSDVFVEFATSPPPLSLTIVLVRVERVAVGLAVVGERVAIVKSPKVPVMLPSEGRRIMIQWPRLTFTPV